MSLPDKAAVHTVTNRTAFEQAVNENDWVLLDFWANWCGPCKTMHPVFHAVAEENPGRFFAAQVDVDEFGELAAVFNVRGVPTLALVHKGKAVDQLVGAQPKTNIQAWIDETLAAA